MLKKFVVSIFVLCFSTPVAFSQVSVTGTGTVYAKPDCADLNFVVVTENIKASVAHSQNATDSTKLFEELKKISIDEKDVKTASFDISEKYSYPTNAEPKFLGYWVTHNVTVKVRDLKKIGSLIDNVVSDSVRIKGISFSVSNHEELVEKARLLALADAKKKAKILSQGLGEELGKLISVNENERGGTAVYQLTTREPGGSQMAPGEKAITVNVNAVWSLR